MVHCRLDPARVLCLGLALLLGCASDPQNVAETSDGIFNGTVVGNVGMFQAVVSVNVGPGICSGVFVHPNYVLTAAHCTQPCSFNGHGATTGCYFGDPTVLGGAYTGVDGAVFSGAAFDGPASASGHRYVVDAIYYPHVGAHLPDMALLHTPDPYGKQVINLLTNFDPNSSIYVDGAPTGILSGFGENNNNDHLRRYGGSVGVYPFDGYYLYESIGPEAGSGDSGGPHFLQRHLGDWRLAGVHTGTAGGWDVNSAVPMAFLDQRAQADAACGGRSWTACVNFAERTLAYSARSSTLTSQFNQYANTYEVYYLGPNNHVEVLFWVNGGWTPFDLTASVGAPPAAPNSALSSQINTTAGTSEVYYVGTNGHVYAFWYNGTWHWFDMTASTGAPVARLDTGLETTRNRTVGLADVYWSGLDGHVNMFWYDGNWHWSEMSRLAGAPPAARGKVGVQAWIFPIERYYVGSDQRLYRLWLDGITWRYDDLTAMAGAPLATPDSGVAVTRSDYPNLISVFYTGSDDKIHQLIRNGFYSWSHVDLSAFSGLPPAPAPTAVLSAFNLAPADPPVVHFLGLDQHIYRYRYDPGDAGNEIPPSWHLDNLGISPATTNAARGAGVTSMWNAANRTRNVFFNGEDRHIYQLGQAPGGGDSWQVTDLTTLTGAPLVAP